MTSTTYIRSADLRSVEIDTDQPEGRELDYAERLSLARRALAPIRLEAHHRMDWSVVARVNEIDRQIDWLERIAASRLAEEPDPPPPRPIDPAPETQPQAQPEATQ